jgi:release factor glutamine methyltransferase
MVLTKSASGCPHAQALMAAQHTTKTDIRSALKSALAQLRAAAVPSHTLAAELLLMNVLGRDRAWLYAHPEEVLTEAQRGEFEQCLARRCAGEPTQYIVGRQEFWGRDFAVGPGVLIPRPETEHVIEVALEMLGPRRAGESFRAADVGTGSGCLAITLALALPHATVLATDISEAALEFARRNAVAHGVAPRIEFVCCHLLDVPARSPHAPHPSSLDLIVSNPPYIAGSEGRTLPREIREHEPPEALFGGAQGHEIYAPLVSQSGKLLAPSGVLVLEMGYNSASRVRALLDSPLWQSVRITPDLSGIPRVIAARKARGS